MAGGGGFAKCPNYYISFIMYNGPQRGEGGSKKSKSPSTWFMNDPLLRLRTTYCIKCIKTQSQKGHSIYY